MSDYGFLVLSVFIAAIVFAIKRNLGSVDKRVPVQRIRYVSEDVILRDRPYENFQKVAFLEAGQQVRLLEKKKGWSKIKLFIEGDIGDDIFGYVRSIVLLKKPMK